MAKRATIRDIASRAGVSVGSVHCALSDKPGVGKETRDRILEIAHALNYRLNTVAASLKRKTALRVAAVFPVPLADNRFYFTHIVGRTLAELLIRQTSPGGGLLLCAGETGIASHSLVARAFETYVRERGLTNPVYTVHENGAKGETSRRIADAFARHSDIAACCCVNAHGSVVLGSVPTGTGWAGRLPAVGSDLFEENVAFLNDGVFTNLLHKNPYSQAYVAAEYLMEYLFHNTPPSQDTIFVGSEIVFQGSLPMYNSNLWCHNGVHLHRHSIKRVRASPHARQTPEQMQ